MKGLTTGRIVHFNDSIGFDHLAAVVVDDYADEDGLVDLFVFPLVERRGGIEEHIPFSEDASIKGTWHWIEPA